MTMLSPAIKAASAFALGGAAFSLANLILARYVSTQEYGQFALLLAILNLGIPLSAIGLDAVTLRQRPGPNLKLFKVSLLVSAVSALVLSAGAWRVYDLDIVVAVVLGIAICGGSVAKMSSAIYQSEQRYRISLWIIQSQNISLMLAAVAAAFVVGVSSFTVFSVLTIHWVAAAIVGWFTLMVFSAIRTESNWRIPWQEIPALFGFIITVQLAAQLDKLLIAKVLDIESLATFGVLSALVLAPYKMFQAGVGYTLIPGLRNSETAAERSASLFREAKATLLVVILGGISGFLLAPWAVKWMLAGKYEFSLELVAAAVFAGTVRVLVMFVSSIVTALGEGEHLTSLNRLSWLALAVSIAAAGYGSRWGLPGFITGFALGSMVRVVFATTIALRVWKTPKHTLPD